MAKYRKKPVVIEAEVYRPGLKDGFRCDDILGIYCKEEYCIILGKSGTVTPESCKDRIPIIKTLEGDHDITPGDFIITGIKGERYPCKSDIFHATYEPVE